ncbi:hypothetical protein CTA2_11506, partial [Colletotrichum tanaceti]
SQWHLRRHSDDDAAGLGHTRHRSLADSHRPSGRHDRIHHGHLRSQRHLRRHPDDNAAGLGHARHGRFPDGHSSGRHDRIHHGRLRSQRHLRRHPDDDVAGLGHTRHGGSPDGHPAGRHHGLHDRLLGRPRHLRRHVDHHPARHRHAGHRRSPDGGAAGHLVHDHLHERLRHLCRHPDVDSARLGHHRHRLGPDGHPRLVHDAHHRPPGRLHRHADVDHPGRRGPRHRRSPNRHPDGFHHRHQRRHRILRGHPHDDATGYRWRPGHCCASDGDPEHLVRDCHLRGYRHVRRHIDNYPPGRRKRCHCCPPDSRPQYLVRDCHLGGHRYVRRHIDDYPPGRRKRCHCCPPDSRPQYLVHDRHIRHHRHLHRHIDDYPPRRRKRRPRRPPHDHPERRLRDRHLGRHRHVRRNLHHNAPRHRDHEDGGGADGAADGHVVHDGAHGGHGHLYRHADHHDGQHGVAADGHPHGVLRGLVAVRLYPVADGHRVTRLRHEHPASDPVCEARRVQAGSPGSSGDGRVLGDRNPGLPGCPRDERQHPRRRGLSHAGPPQPDGRLSARLQPRPVPAEQAGLDLYPETAHHLRQPRHRRGRRRRQRQRQRLYHGPRPLQPGPRRHRLRLPHHRPGRSRLSRGDSPAPARPDARFGRPPHLSRRHHEADLSSSSCGLRQSAGYHAQLDPAPGQPRRLQSRPDGQRPRHRRVGPHKVPHLHPDRSHRLLERRPRRTVPELHCLHREAVPHGSSAGLHQPRRRRQQQRCPHHRRRPQPGAMSPEPRPLVDAAHRHRLLEGRLDRLRRLGLPEPPRLRPRLGRRQRRRQLDDSLSLSLSLFISLRLLQPHGCWPHLSLLSWTRFLFPTFSMFLYGVEGN